jgi:hypothetical protein
MCESCGRSWWYYTRAAFVDIHGLIRMHYYSGINRTDEHGQMLPGTNGHPFTASAFTHLLALRIAEIYFSENQHWNRESRRTLKYVKHCTPKCQVAIQFNNPFMALYVETIPEFATQSIDHSCCNCLMWCASALNTERTKNFKSSWVLFFMVYLAQNITVVSALN